MRMTLPAFVALLAIGCQRPNATLADRIPRGTDAYPWVADGAVDCGPFEAAAAAAGDTPGPLEALHPVEFCRQAFLNPAESRRRVTLRAFRFVDETAAKDAVLALRPALNGNFDAGDEGVWLDDGVLVRSGTVVFELRVRDDESPGPAEAAVFVWSQVEKRILHAERSGS